MSDFPVAREKTEIKVLKTVKELNYEINAIARSLIQKETNTIGIIVGNVLSNKLEYDDNKTLKKGGIYEKYGIIMTVLYFILLVLCCSIS